MEAAAFYVAVLGLMLLALSVLVVRERQRTKVGLGHGSDSEGALARACRAHGNFCEYAPLFGLLLVLSASIGMEIYLIHAFGFVFVLSRVAHAIGLSQTSGRSWGRAIGALGTWTALGLLAIVMIAMVFL
jgi:uncharacterized membrane protein YecN with MAPEG domain